MTAGVRGEEGLGVPCDDGDIAEVRAVGERRLTSGCASAWRQRCRERTGAQRAPKCVLKPNLDRNVRHGVVGQLIHRGRNMMKKMKKCKCR
eukprot:8658803-Pyramimonas_sp.AAC.1